MLTAPLTIPLSALQQRDVAGLQAQANAIQDKLNMIARTVIAGHGTDPDTLAGYAINMEQPAAGIVITPPAKPTLMEA